MERSSLGHSFQGIHGYLLLFYCWRGWHTSIGCTLSCAHGLMGFVDGIGKQHMVLAWH
jgi:hypothetical protein